MDLDLAPATGPATGEGDLALTRVMSPSGGQPGIIAPYFLGSYECEVCNFPVDDGVFVRAQCCEAGLRQRLRLEAVPQLPDYAFCQTCIPWVITQQSRLQTQADQQRWSIRLAAAMAAWRQTSVGATGVLGTLGVSIGGGQEQQSFREPRRLQQEPCAVFVLAARLRYL